MNALAITQTHGADQHCLVSLSKGKAVTDSLAVAMEFGRRHDNVLQSLDGLIKDGTINRLEFKAVKFIDAKGEQRRKIELSERGALIAMPFIGGRNSRIGQAKLVNAFLAMREALANQAPWVESRQAAATSYLAMCEALQETRAAQGKPTKNYHYSNEAHMLNQALFGVYGAIDRTTLASKECTLLGKMEYKNAILISAGKSRSERKHSLHIYALNLRVVALRQAQKRLTPAKGKPQ